MSWVSIDHERCNQCGLCVIRCPACYASGDGAIAVQADQDTCICCGHCISLCPMDAIEHRRMDMANFPPVEREVEFDAGDFTSFLRQRRSHRHFKNEAIPRETLEALVDICRYAPTGSNRQAVEIRVIEGPDRIKLLSDLTVDHFMRMLQQIEEQVEKFKAEVEELPADLAALHANTVRYKRMAEQREAGVDVVFRKAPCVMIFHASPRKATTPKDDCVIAAQTVSMLARTMQLETCYIGLFTAASHAYPPIMKELRLPEDHKVYSALILGYPKLKYLRAVDRQPIEVTWE